MEPQPSTSAGTNATAASTPAESSPKDTDGGQNAVVVASTSGSPPPVHVQQQQQHKHLIFNYPATFQQIHQLFAMNCRIKLQQCDAGGPADLRNVRKVKEESDTDSNSSDEDEIKVFPAPLPQVAAPSTHNGATRGTKEKVGKRVVQRKSSSRCCTICRKTFNSAANLRPHMQRRHSGDNRYRCDNCGASFWNQSSFSKHKKKMTQRNGVCPPKRSGGWRPKGSWTCKICGKRFKHPNYYVIHMRFHRGEKPFKCGDCGKAFPSSGRLSYHRRIHASLGPYSCVFCDQRFRWQTNFFSHLRGHTEEKPYICKVKGCGASFRYLNSLTFHQRKTHS